MEPTKISFNKTAFISSLKNHLQQLESETEAKLKSLMKEEAESKVSEMDNISVKFKDIVNITPKDGTTFPDEIYSAVLKRVVIVEAPKLSGGTWGEGAIIKQLGAYIAELLDTNTETITVDGTTYMLSNDFGSTVSLVNVAIKGKKNAKYKFIWDDTNDTTRKSLDDYMKSLLVLEKERLLDVFIALLKDADKAGIIDTAKDTAKDLLSKWVKALMNGKKLNSLSNLTDFEFLRQLSLSNIKQTDNLVTSAIKEVNKEVSDILEDIKDVVNPSRKLKALLMVVDTLDEFVAWTKEAFDDSKNKIDNITKKYNKFPEETVQLADYFVSNEDVEISSESIAKSKAYKNFIKAFNNLETTIGESETSFDSILSENNIYEFTDVTDAVISENNAIINGTNNADTIKSTGTNVTIDGNGENDSITTTSSKALVNGGTGNDTIRSGGFNSKIYGNEGDDIIYVEGKQTSVDGGYGNDTIVVNNSDVTVNGGENFDGLPVIDTIILSSDSEDVVVNDFDKDDILNLTAYNASDLSAGKYQTNSLEIWSRKTYKTIAILSGVTNGTNENIICKDDNGDVIRVSLNWILENTPPITNPYDTLNPYDNLKPSQVVIVPINENINNSRDDVIITALSGDHSIENSGNAVTINGGSDRDRITNTGNNVNIDGKAGNDIISNGFENDSSSSSQPIKGGDNVVINGGEGTDLIYNYDGLNAQIDGDEGTDTIYNTGSDGTLNGGTDDDKIDNSGENVSINGGSGDDTLTNESDFNVTIDGGYGSDHITNEGANALVDGNDGDDYINNDNASSVTLIGGNGNDHIWNSGSNISITSDVGDDYISNNKGFSVTINGGDDNDTINNTGSNVSITSNAGKDSVSNSGNNVSINSDLGDDYIYSNGDAVVIDSGLGDDTIRSRGENISIEAGDGNNFIDQYGNGVTITSGKDNDTIHYIGKNISIDSGDGNDSIRNEASYNNRIIQDSGDNSTINSGGGNDTIYNLGSNVVINSGENDDHITNDHGNNTSINGGTGNDTIRNVFNSNYATINGGIGDDSIDNNSSNSTINGGIGDDSISNGGSNATIDGDSGDDYINNLADNSIIDGGLGNDTIKNRDFNVLIRGGADDDFIYNEGSSYTTIDGGEGNDFIETHYSTGVNKYDDTNEGRYVSINSGEGNDSIENGDYYTTIDGSFGNDYISNIGYNVSINGGDGNDFIENKVQYFSYYITTINGGSDNDTISLYDDPHQSNIIQYNFGDGNDVIYNFDENDTLSITGSSYTSLKNDNNIILTVGNGKISLIGAANFSRLNINGTLNSGNIPPTPTITPATNVGVTIGNTLPNATINSTDYADYIYNASSGKSVTINAKDGNDTINNEGEAANINAGAGNDLIDSWIDSDYATINGGSGDDSIKSLGNSVKIYADSGNDFIDLFDGSNNTLISGTGNDTVSIGSYSKNNIIQYAFNDGNDIIYGFDSTDTLIITGNTYNSVQSGNNLILSIGKNKITLVSASNLSKVNIIGTPNEGSDNTPADTIPTEQSHPTPIQILDDIGVNRTSVITFSNNSGNDIQDIDFHNFGNSQVISLKSGNQNVQFNDENGNVAIVGETATGSKNIIFGNGNDLGIFYSPNADIKTTLGSGNDSILVDNNARVQIDMTNADNAAIIPYSGRVTLDNYNSDSRAGVLLPDIDNIANAVKDNSIQLVGDEVRTDSASVKFNNTDSDSPIVNLMNKHGGTRRVGFTGTRGGTLDTTDKRGNFLLKGNYAENASDTQKNRGSTIIAGVGNNSILAGSGDVVDGGGGNNQIYLTPQSLRQTKAGATIVLSNNGQNIVHGFNEGFDYDSDYIKVDDLDNLKFKFETDGLLLRSDYSRLKFDGIGIHTASSDTASNLASDIPEKILITDGSSTINAAIAQPDQSVAVTNDESELPNVFFGDHSGLNFSGYNGDVNIDLSQEIGKLGDEDVKLYGIDKLQGGDRSSTLIGNNGNNTLVAGKGQTSIHSGAGHDKLFGNTDADKNVATFYYTAGDGRDSIENFDFMTNMQDVTADKVQLDDNSAVTDVLLRDSDVMIKVDDADGFLMLEDAQGKSFRLNDDIIAKVDTNVTFDGFSNCYVGIGSQATLTVGKGLGNVEVWLSDDLLEYHGNMYDGNFKVLDASQADGSNILAGNELNNSILGGEGNDSLWGGYTSSNDTLVGGSGHNTFFYLQGNGRDVIQNAHDDDNIILDDITLDQISEANITSGGIAISFTDGGSLIVTGSTDVTYQLADGSRYSANHSTFEWQDK